MEDDVKGKEFVHTAQFFITNYELSALYRRISLCACV